MNRELITVISQIATEKNIDKEVLFEALESALLSAFKKTMGVGTGDNIRLELDRGTGTLWVFAKKRVVAKVTDARIEMTLAEARAVIGRWRHDYNHVRPHSAHGGLAPETVRLNHADSRLRDVNSCADRPLPPEQQISYEARGLPL